PDDTEEDYSRKFKKYLTDSELYTGLVTSASGNCVALNFTLTPEGNREYRHDVMDLVREKASLIAGDRTFYMVGQPVHGSELDRLSEHVKKLYSVVMFIAFLLLLYLCRSVFLALFGTVSVALTLLLVQTYAFHRGFTINAVTAAMPALLIVISLSNVIHLVIAFRQRLGGHGDVMKALEEANDHVAWPCFFNAFTTGVGFLSLIVSSLDPIRQLGELVCVGVFIAYFFCLVGVNMGISILRKGLAKTAPEKTEEEDSNPVFRGLANFAISARYLVVLAAIGVTWWGVWSIKQLNVDSNPMEFFPKGSPFRQSYGKVEKDFTGLSPFSLQIHSETSLRDPENLRKIEWIQNFLRSDPQLKGRVADSVSAVDFIKETNRTARGGGPFNSFIPNNPEVLNRVFEEMPTALKNQMEQSFLSEDEHWGRIAVQSYTLSSSEYDILLTRVDEWMTENFPEFEAKSIGIVPLINNTQETILRGQIESFSLAGGIIAIVFLFLLRNPFAMVVYMLSCIFPIMVTLATMFWLKISLNASTSTIACVAIGIAVDDCIHFYYRYKTGLRKFLDRREAIRYSLDHAGRAIYFSSVINIIGFSTLFFSGFMPTIYFGGLLAVTMTVALISVLILLPAAILVFGIDRINVKRLKAKAEKESAELPGKEVPENA
ncbi:MAG: MMPL family transporter, partial [Candidatus Omnitrophica bacterium]|nr:MMPL family transporter [Candidatus Omnitrophota bacterium]